MDLISEFLVSHMVAVYFVYGLAFFTLGIALLIGKRRTSAFRFASAIIPLALFGLLHGAHEWLEMFQRIAARDGYVPAPWHEAARIALLAVSFALLLAFALLLLGSENGSRRRAGIGVGVSIAVWAGLTAFCAFVYRADLATTIALADVFSRYAIGIPAALMAAWALMTQQRSFRESNMPEFGASLVWCAAALILYGGVGQLFVRPTPLPISTVLNSANFLEWFGIPVQLFRAAMAALLTIFMLRVLGVFELEESRRLSESNDARLAAQSAALEAARTSSQRLEKVNQELKRATQKLSLLVDISSTLQDSSAWPEPLSKALDLILNTMSFADAGLILLKMADAHASVVVTLGFPQSDAPHDAACGIDPLAAAALGEGCIEDGMLHCVHEDGSQLRINLVDVLAQQECRRHASPTTCVALPIMSAERIIGSLVLAGDPQSPSNLSSADLALMVGIAQEMGRSIENALLQQQLLERENMLAQLLGKVVSAQEGERQRIARELHDTTGQSLTAIGLGLRGIQTQLERLDGDPALAFPLEQLGEVLSYSNIAIRELHNIMADLRPSQLDELGLKAAIQWYVQSFEQRHGIPVQFRHYGDTGSLPEDYNTVLFRIMQEALRNVARHANASEVDVDLRRTDQAVSLVVRENGCGFDPSSISIAQESQTGWGLAGMKERAALVGGCLDLTTAPGAGAEVKIQIPLNPSHNPVGGENPSLTE